MPPMRKPKGQLGQAKKGTMKRLLKILFKNYRWSLIISLICIVIYSFGNLASSIFMREVTNILTECIKNGEDPLSKMTMVLIIIGSIYIVSLLCGFWYSRTMAVVTQKYLNTIRIQMFNHMESLPIKYFDTHPRGDIMSIYTNDTDTIRQLISQALPTVVQSLFTVVAVLLMMVYFSLPLTGVVIIGSIAMIVSSTLLTKKSGKYFVKQQVATGKVESDIEEAINGLKVIKVFSHEEKSTEEFEVKNEELCHSMTIANQTSNILGPVNQNIGNLVYVLLVVLGSAFMIYNIDNIGFQSIFNGLSTGNSVFVALDYGTLLMFLIACRTFSNGINNFSNQIQFVVLGQAGASRIFDLLDEQEETDNGYVTLVNIEKKEDGTIVETDKKTRLYAWKHPHQADGTVTYTELKGDIVLDHVDFGYEPDHLVLHDVSIYAHPGQKIAFVGATGAGKTTITNLINRFYDIADGKIRYDGININKIKKDDLRRSLGVVLQDTNLFTGTVMENIRYGRLDATDEEVYEAAKIANAYDFITRLPDGFNTMLSGDGTNLSQGQRQLLSIARAAVADAPVMILDEATSSIDTRTEKLVQKGMDKLMEGRTVFVIAHRLSTVQNSQAIMVLDHGRIIERGTHEDLIKQKGVYYQLYTGAFELE